MEAKKSVEPEPGESQRDFMGRCVAFYGKEGYARDQAVGMCTRIWADGKAVGKPPLGVLEREKTGLAMDKGLEGRRILFVMSDELPDRSGDVVKLDGWDLTGFMKNPVFLSMHDSTRYPIGTWEKVWVEQGQLRGVARFADAGTHQEADLAYSLYKQGIMNAVSVKFLGREYEPNDFGGLTFTGHEMLECSAVPVPANANALAIARNYDVRTREMFLKDQGPDAAVEKADEAKADVATESAGDGPEISDRSLANVLSNLKGD